MHQLAVHAIGGVIAAGETVMWIVPQDEELAVEARIAPQDIDQIEDGQRVKLRFSAFNQRYTPEIAGEVTRIAADIVQDQQGGAGFYPIRIAANADELARLGELVLIPGMPVEVFAETGGRTVLSYLVKPLTDQLTKAFREE